MQGQGSQTGPRIATKGTGGGALAFSLVPATTTYLNANPKVAICRAGSDNPGDSERT